MTRLLMIEFGNITENTQFMSEICRRLYFCHHAGRGEHSSADMPFDHGVLARRGLFKRDYRKRSKPVHFANVIDLGILLNALVEIHACCMYVQDVIGTSGGIACPPSIS